MQPRTRVASGVAGNTAGTARVPLGLRPRDVTTGDVYGVYGITLSSTFLASGVYGQANEGAGNTFGVHGINPSTSGTAVEGDETATTGFTLGVGGTITSPGGYAVWGNAQSTDTSGTAYGVYGQSANGDAVHGVETAANGSGVAGIASSNGSGLTEGVAGVNISTSGHSNGVYGTTASADGVAGLFDNSAGGYILLGRVNGGPDLFHVDGSGGGHFAGAVQIDGNLNVGGTLTKGGGSFKIDDPLDPANKYLSHSFVESPDMMNIYNGNVTTDKRGLATVVLPGYFDALNRDFRYQLTVIGQFAQAIVAKEIDQGRFTIRTNRPGVKVSWQVTGIRQDAWANAYRIPNEENKPLDQRGTYLYPELYGGAADKKANARLRP